MRSAASTDHALKQMLRIAIESRTDTDRSTLATSSIVCLIRTAQTIYWTIVMRHSQLCHQRIALCTVLRPSDVRRPSYCGARRFKAKVLPYNSTQRSERKAFA